MPQHRAGTARVTRTLLLLMALSVLGCAGKVQTTHEQPGFGREELARGRLGLGGIVLAGRLAGDAGTLPPHDVAPDDHFGQATAWSPLLYGELLARGDGVTIWPWPTVRDACGDSLLAPVLAAIAQASVLRPAQLTGLSAALDGIRYLAFGRVDGDEVTLLESGPGTTQNPQVRDNRDPHATGRRRTTKIRRTVTVTLDIYDLTEGRSIWTTTAERHRDELYDFNAWDAGREAGVVPEGEPVITVDGRSLPAPSFAKVLGAACGALADRLLQRPQS